MWKPIAAIGAGLILASCNLSSAEPQSGNWRFEYEASGKTYSLNHRLTFNADKSVTFPDVKGPAFGNGSWQGRVISLNYEPTLTDFSDESYSYSLTAPAPDRLVGTIRISSQKGETRISEEHSVRGALAQ